jgi:hypothetical protein
MQSVHHGLGSGMGQVETFFYAARPSTDPPGRPPRDIGPNLVPISFPGPDAAPISPAVLPCCSVEYSPS